MLGDSGLGHYELVERLATRTASELFVVKVSGEHGFQRHIVLERLRDDARAARFIADAKLAAQLSHAKIVQTLELGRVDGAPYMATEYVDGVDLLGLMRELAHRGRALEPSIAAFIAQEVLDALDYAHTLADARGAPLGIVHARLAPTKVLLGEAGEVKVRDFGVARPIDLEQVSEGRDYGHLAPEQVMELELDARADVFAVGVLLAEMLVGRRLFAARNEFDVLLMVRDVRLARFDARAPHLDPELVVTTRRALQRQPGARWPTAAAFRDALDAWCFARREQGMKQRLAALVGELRTAIDATRHAAPAATAFDDLSYEDVPASASSHLPRVAIPPKRPVANLPLDATPAPAPPREPARGTVEPETELDLAIATAPRARGTVEPASFDGLDAPTTKLPDVRIADAEAELAPAAVGSKPEPVARTAHPRLLPRKPAVEAGEVSTLGASLETLLPARAPVEQTGPLRVMTPEQVANATQPALPTLVPPDRAPDDGGDFARTVPLRVLFRLMRTRATGLLAVESARATKHVYVRDGQIVGVRSNRAADLFGTFLVAHQVVSEGELAMALATMSHYGGKLADTLVELRLVKRVEVFRYLTSHARERVVDVCTWADGRYAWYGDATATTDAFPPDAEAFTMLGAGALALGDAVVAAWLDRQREVSLVLAKAPRVTADRFGLPGLARALAQVDGTRTLGEIVDHHPIDQRGEVARLMFLGTACDLVHVAGSPPRKA